MRKLRLFASLLVITLTSITLIHCGGGGGGSSPAEQIHLQQLSGTWTLDDVALGTEDKNGEFSNFTLNISGTFNANNPEGPYQFAVSGNHQDPSPWPLAAECGGTCTWEFASVPTTTNGVYSGTIIRIADSKTLVYSISSTGTLTLELTCGDGDCQYEGNPARVGSVEGNWVFEFSKQ